MNKCYIIGNLTRDPELRQTQEGITVCNFTVAVNRRTRSDHPEADYFRVTAWRGLGDMCGKYLGKGKKVCCIGAVSTRTYVGSDGNIRASMELVADDVEFLTPRSQTDGFTQVDSNEAEAAFR